MTAETFIIAKIAYQVFNSANFLAASVGQWAVGSEQRGVVHVRVHVNEKELL